MLDFKLVFFVEADLRDRVHDAFVLAPVVDLELHDAKFVVPRTRTV
jgi:hypothetical protein